MIIRFSYINEMFEEVNETTSLEIINNNIYMRVDSKMILNENKELIQDPNNSIQLKFETPYNQPISIETRKALYDLHRQLTIHEGNIKDFEVYDDNEILLFSSYEFHIIPGVPFIIDTALNMSQNNDKYIGVSIPLKWEAE